MSKKLSEFEKQQNEAHKKVVEASKHIIVLQWYDRDTIQEIMGKIISDDDWQIIVDQFNRYGIHYPVTDIESLEDFIRHTVSDVNIDSLPDLIDDVDGFGGDTGIDADYQG